MWCHLPTSIGRRRLLRFIAVAFMAVALITTLVFASVSHAAPGTSKTISFQGRLLTAAGAVVPDGHYNMQFKIYQDGSGTAAGNPDGTLKWTETYTNNGGNDGVEVKNGFFSVNLGSLIPFGTSVDWNQDTLFLSMNVAGSATACTTFGSAPCGADGEMLPMKRITATPFSINSGAVGGKTADDLVQLGQGTQTDASNNSSIAINKTGTGNLVQLQAGGNDAFTVNNAGSVTMGASTDQSLSVATSSSGGGKSLTVSAGSSASGSNQAGGDLALQGGAGDGSGTSGNVVVKSSGSDTTGTFQVQNTAGDTVFNVDAANKVISAGTIKLGSGTAGASTSLWNNGTMTGTVYDNTGAPLNVGTTFTSDVAGYVTGIKFYNVYNNNTASDVGKLWACNNPTCSLGNGGTLLASVNITQDPTEGWKTASFNTPVAIQANTYYIVTYYSANGHYVATSHYFDSDYNNTPLHAPSGNTIPNGVFNTDDSANFPTNTYNNTSYWVDVNFQPSISVDQISSSNNLTISSAGAMTVGPTSQALNLQGSAINIGATNGGNVTVQGGNAMVSDGNGGSILLTGGAGDGTGARGLVVLATPTFSTTSNDANCYTSGAVVTSSCTVATTTVDNSSAVMVGFSNYSQIATIPNPTIKTAGRIMYVMAAGDSKVFTLANSDGTAIATMAANSTTTLLWNGSVWTTAGGSGITTLQDVYNNSAQYTTGANMTLNNIGSTLTIQDSSTNPVQNGGLLNVTNAASTSLFSVNSKVTGSTEYVSDGGVTDGPNFTNNWWHVGDATMSRVTTDGQASSDSIQAVTGTTADSGLLNKLSTSPLPSTKYRISVYAKLTAGSSFSDFTVRYSPDGVSTAVDCANYNTQTVTSGWTQITCDMMTGMTPTTTSYLYLVQPTAPGSGRTFLVDNLSMTLASSATPNVKVGTGTGSGQTTLLTLDNAAAAPTASDNNSLLGSMYYDTALGKVQCYEASGWGTCGSSPDIFVSLSPTYANAVTHGAGSGTLSSDLCSSALHINDGTSSQPTICGTNETYNFYKWTSAQATAQTNDMYVTYQLPSTFKKFVASSASLMGRTDSNDSSVAYQIYRNNPTTGLTACGSSVATSTGVQSSWQTAIAAGSADPSSCSFSAGDSIVFKVTFSSKNNANAYISNLNFIYSNH